MKVGLMPLFGGETSEPDYVARIARGLEERGFSSVWAVDHVLIPKEINSSYPYAKDGSFPVDPTLLGLEPFALLTYIAAHTNKIRLGTGVVVLPQRNPTLTAKQAADVDVFEFHVGIASNGASTPDSNVAVELADDVDAARV